MMMNLFPKKGVPSCGKVGWTLLGTKSLTLLFFKASLRLEFQQFLSKIFGRVNIIWLAITLKKPNLVASLLSEQYSLVYYAGEGMPVWLVYNLLDIWEWGLDSNRLISRIWIQHVKDFQEAYLMYRHVYFDLGLCLKRH